MRVPYSNKESVDDKLANLMCGIGAASGPHQLAIYRYEVFLIENWDCTSVVIVIRLQPLFEVKKK